jgi:hypothetical protein
MAFSGKRRLFFRLKSEKIQAKIGEVSPSLRISPPQEIFALRFRPLD